MRNFSLPLLLTIVLCLGALPFLFAQQATTPSAAPEPAFDEVSERRFHVGPSFLYDGTSAGGPVDAFAPSAEPSANDRPVSSVQQTLSDELGIEFPEGTYARYDPRTGALQLRHYPAAMKAIQAYLEALNPPQRQLKIGAEIYQLATHDAMSVQRLSDTQDDDQDVWEVVQNLVRDKTSGAKVVSSVSMQVRSGQRARADDMAEFIYPTEVDWYKEDRVIVPAAFETRNYGTILEVDPVLGADDITVDLNFSLEHHTAPPTMHPITVASPEDGVKLTTVEMPEFHCKRITTQIVMRANTIKLIGTWRPTGKPEFEDADLMQVVFLRVSMQTIRNVVPIK